MRHYRIKVNPWGITVERKGDGHRWVDRWTSFRSVQEALGWITYYEVFPDEVFHLEVL